MPETRQAFIKDLSLDLKNFRTVPQEDEIGAVKAMISISPDKFSALMNSILDDGYLPTENVIVLAETKTNLIVKEGNRRIAALKIIHGLLKHEDFNIPTAISTRISNITNQWKKDNDSVPTTIYEKSDATTVDKIVALTHGKGEQAGRDQWKSVATARHNRDMAGLAEPALDFLEKYLLHGKNITTQQKERWAGDYHLTVLDEALKKHLAARLGYANALDIVAKYPTIKYRDETEEIIREIGLGNITFTTMRNSKVDNFAEYGIPPVTNNSANTNTSTPGSSTDTETSSASSGNNNSSNGSNQGTRQGRQSNASSSNRGRTYATNDPRYVKATLKKFNPIGNNRQKVATLKDEAWRLNRVHFIFSLVKRHA